MNGVIRSNSLICTLNFRFKEETCDRTKQGRRHAFERDQLELIVSSHKNEQTNLKNDLAEQNYLATAPFTVLELARRNLKVSIQNETERRRSTYMMALEDMKRALSRTQK